MAIEKRSRGRSFIQCCETPNKMPESSENLNILLGTILQLSRHFLSTYNYIAVSLGTRDTTINKPEYLYWIIFFFFAKTPNIVYIILYIKSINIIKIRNVSLNSNSILCFKFMTQYHLPLLEIILIETSLTVIHYKYQVPLIRAYCETASDYKVEN